MCVCTEVISSEDIFSGLKRARIRPIGRSVYIFDMVNLWAGCVRVCVCVCARECVDTDRGMCACTRWGLCVEDWPHNVVRLFKVIFLFCFPDLIATGKTSKPSNVHFLFKCTNWLFLF